jgi:DNA repair protein RecO (recombination protein O)
MPVHDAEGIVLRQYSLGEADRIVVFLTRESGKLRAVAPGSKRPRSRTGACLEPLNHVRISYFLKERSDLGRIRECETLHSYLGKTSSLPQIYGFIYFAELVQELAQENLANPLLFRLFISCLDVGEARGVTGPLLRYFELWSLKLSGFLPDYGSCSDCGRCVKDDGFFARPDTGVGRCKECARGQGIAVSATAAAALDRIRSESPEKFVTVNSTAGDALDLEILAQRLLELHLERRLKSYGDLAAILRGR